jgi:hypothetical protein
MTNPTFPQFNSYVCEGDAITWSAEGFDLCARVWRDSDTKPTEYDCYEPADIERWKNDEWFYCGVVVSVSLNGVELSDHASSLWGVDCNFGDDNAYLADVAQELEEDALITARHALAQMRKALGGVYA